MRDRLIVGIAQGFGASLQAPGHAHHNDMKAIKMSAYSHADRKAIALVAAIFRNAEFDAITSEDILSIQWEKLICNVAYSALCALTGQTVGQVLEDPIIGPISRNAAIEAWQTTKDNKIDNDIAGPVQLVPEFTQRMPNAKPSALLDIETGRFSEISMINGAISRAAAKAGKSAPINATHTALVLVLALEQRTIRA